MTKFKKGNKYGFKQGHFPHNKQRKCVQTTKSDTKIPVYERLTRDMTRLVQNVPYPEDPSNSQERAEATKLLRPIDDVPKKLKSKPSVKEIQRYVKNYM